MSNKTYTVQGMNNGHDPINFTEEFETPRQAADFIRTHPDQSFASAHIFDSIGLAAIWTVTGNKITTIA